MKRMFALATGAIPLTLAAALAAMPAGATSGLSVGDDLGKTEAEIRATLEAAGHTVDEIETEDGYIEVEYAMNGAAFEAEVDPDTGLIVEIEADDSDDDDDEDGDD